MGIITLLWLEMYFCTIWNGTANRGEYLVNQVLQLVYFEVLKLHFGLYFSESIYFSLHYILNGNIDGCSHTIMNQISIFSTLNSYILLIAFTIPPENSLKKALTVTLFNQVHKSTHYMYHLSINAVLFMFIQSSDTKHGLTFFSYYVVAFSFVWTLLGHCMGCADGIEAVLLEGVCRTELQNFFFSKKKNNMCFDTSLGPGSINSVTEMGILF